MSSKAIHEVGVAAGADRKGPVESLAIIVPVFNEKDAIGGVIESLLAARGAATWEILVVDDGSTDGTAAIVDRYADRVRILRHPWNRGYGASLKTGILSTRAENVLFFDGDGQHDAADLPAFVQGLESCECVFGVRPKGAGVPAIRKPGKWALAQVCNFLAVQKIPDINCGFRAGRRRMFMRMLDLLPDGFSFSITSLMFVLKSRISWKFIPIRCHFRQGTSSVRIVQDGVKAVLLALRLIMLFDPMRALGYPAIALVLVGVLYQIFILATYGLHIVGGSILSILAGIILFHFGLLADQIASLRKEISSHNSLYWEEHAAAEEKRAPDRA
jgi:glycosyltransferase involved in cell wall biosynthesis